MNVTIAPSFAAGQTDVPPSKSMAHRLLICAFLSGEECTVKNVELSEDILATLDCLETLGAKYRYENGNVYIRGTQSPSAASPLFCRECGSTLRFLIPICLLSEKETTLTGSTRLLSRPLNVYEDVMRSSGLPFSRTENSITVRGRLVPGTFNIPGNVSSQFVSGLMFALPMLNGDSTINLIPPIESRPYILMTAQAMAAFGVTVSWADENTINIRGGQHFSPADVTVEGDWSNAAFLEALNISGGNVTVGGLSPQSLQGDKIYTEYFEKLMLSDCTLDISDCPDLGPILFAVAAMKNGGTFTGTNRLSIKESDRALAMKTELEKFGVETDIEDDSVTVRASHLKTPSTPLYGHNDHRIVMALSVLAVQTGGTICGAEVVKKSFPDFFEQLKTLGVSIHTEMM